MDDTHALGVFSSPEAASEALASPNNPTVKSRPLNMASTASKLKAKSVCELLLPYKARPATSTAPARRLLQVTSEKDNGNNIFLIFLITSLVGAWLGQESAGGLEGGARSVEGGDQK